MMGGTSTTTDGPAAAAPADVVGVGAAAVLTILPAILPLRLQILREVEKVRRCLARISAATLFWSTSDPPMDAVDVEKDEEIAFETFDCQRSSLLLGRTFKVSSITRSYVSGNLFAASFLPACSTESSSSVSNPSFRASSIHRRPPFHGLGWSAAAPCS